MTPGARVLVFLVRVYQTFFSALMPSACKFYPSCSHYAAEALRVHGARRGTWLALKRLGRCHPFTRGGVDLVPERGSVAAAAARVNAISPSRFIAAVAPADCHSERSEESLLHSAIRAERFLASQMPGTSAQLPGNASRELFSGLDFPAGVATRTENRQAEACPTNEVSS